MNALRTECFRAWPAAPAKALAEKPASASAGGLRLTTAEFRSEAPFNFPLWLLHREDVAPENLELVVLNLLDDDGWMEFQASATVGFPAQFSGVAPDGDAFAQVRGMLMSKKWAMAYTSPRGAGPQSWSALSSAKQTHLRRRLLLLGESLESGQVWDIQQAAAALRSLPGMGKVPLWLQAENAMAANALYASLFIPEVTRLDLHHLPATHRDGPTYLNVLRHLDLPQAAALAAERATLAIYSASPDPWRYAEAVATALKWGDKRVQIRVP
jgi:hypothetical protein